MRSLVKAFKTWRSGRQQFSPEDWAKVRAKGRGRFVLREAFSYTVYTVAIWDLVTQFTDYGHPFRFASYIFQFAFSGIFLGYWTWGDHEVKYKKALQSSSQTSIQSH
jgi:hypothetical protein